MSIAKFNLSVILLLLASEIHATGNLPPMSKKNINEVSNFFNDKVGKRAELEDRIELDREGAITNIKNNAVLNEFSNKFELESKAAEYSNMNLNEAEGKGHIAKNENNELWNKANINYNDPQVLMHKQDVDKIANASEKLIHRLFDKLKELGIDCRQKKGPKDIEPEMYIELEKIPQKEVTYDKHLCEYLRNNYNCKDSLSVKCADPGYVPGRLTNVTGNMTHTLDSNGTLTIGVNRTAYFYNAWGSQHDFNFSFNIDNAKGINSFKLLQIDWADYVLVKLNDNIIFQGPYGYGKIEMSQNPAHYRVGPDDERYFGVDLGNGNYVSANTKRYYSNSPNVEAKQFLKDGNNNLNIRLVYGKGGKIWTQVKFTERVCRNWIETWDEKCSID